MREEYRKAKVGSPWEFLQGIIHKAFKVLLWDLKQGRIIKGRMPLLSDMLQDTPAKPHNPS
jgi:hypothetical protein